MYKQRLICVGLVALCFLFLAAAAAAQEEDEKKLTREQVPAAVLAAFTKAYPKAKIIGFTEEKDDDGKTVFEVESTEGDVHRDVTYYPDGTLVVVEESLPADALPAAVKQTIQKESPGATIVLAEKLMRGKTIEYEMHMKEGTKEFELLINPAGKLLKRENK